MSQSAPTLSHVNQQGKAKMVDVAAKDDTQREAVASGKVLMKITMLLLL
jgi:cyclic pyranopterin phosphate synthase